MPTKAQSMIGFNPDGRPEHDFYPTPPSGTIALLEQEKFAGKIWEPACGDGAMARVLEMYGYEVVGSDIEPRGYGHVEDFLHSTELLAPNIITNPPFKWAQEFAEQGVRLGAEKMCLLLKINFLEGIDRSVFLAKSRLTKVLVFRRRLTIMRPGQEKRGGGMMTYAWFIWIKGYAGKPEIGWV